MTEEAERRQTILVAYDGSPAAQAAAGLAIQVAQRHGFLIRGLHVVDERLVMETYADRREELEGEEEPASRAELIAWFEFRGMRMLSRLEARCHSAGVPVITELVFGGIPEQVVREAAQACLLVLGRRAHAHQGRPEYLGSNFRAIAHHVSVPLLVGGNAQPPVERILLSYDGSECARRAAHWCALLQQTFSAHVSVVPFWHDGDGTGTSDWKDETDAYLSRVGLVDYRFVRQETRGTDGVTGAAVEEQANMVVLGACRHPAFPGQLLGHSEDSVLRRVEIPVVLI
jgi:nucleotide-binding universal stress UspA family protein